MGAGGEAGGGDVGGEGDGVGGEAAAAADVDGGAEFVDEEDGTVSTTSRPIP